LIKEICYDLTVLVATKDRLQQITKLLESLENSSKIPGTVIVVHSGIDIEHALSKLNTTYKLVLMKSSIASQVYQKKLGLNSLPSFCNWVLFLDDDVVVYPNSIELLVDKYLSNVVYSKYAGFGLSIKNRVLRNSSEIVSFLLSIVKLYSSQPGHLTKAGHPQSYLGQKNNCEVDWLNGISVWRKNLTDHYFDVPFIPGYSAYEDVMFSYKVSRANNLLFTADVFVADQFLENPIPLTFKQFIAGSYARYVFVNTYPEMSKFWMISSQIVRNLDFILRSKNEGALGDRVSFAFTIWFKMLLRRLTF
jgi:hypothetical protein